MRRRVLLLKAALGLFVLVAGTLAPVTAGAAPGGEPGPNPGTPVAIKTKSDDAKEKIHPHLLEAIEEASPTKAIRFVARIVAGTDLSPYTDSWFARPFVDPLGTTVASGHATSTELVKMAADSGVVSLQLPESLVDPPQPVDPDLAEARREALVPELRLAGEASPGPAPEGWYSTTGSIHASQDAWDKGYTGQGVRYMSNDSGADYCHPDLEGTWAYIDDPSSPYHGLPQMFDSVSSYFAAFDFYVGTTLIADGEADFADTSTVLTPVAQGNNAVLQGKYRPIGAKNEKTYKLPSTSLSGEYHIGSHPDKALADVADIISRGLFPGAAKAARGERAGILVIDEHTAGVYDTVYVDLNYNYDFRDDAPARLGGFSGEETACLDYDSDGLNDVSGGLVYFISDGATSVPTLDWYWGIPGTEYGNGDLVAFHVNDFTEGGGTHGMGTTSVAVAQGVVAGSLNWGPGGSPIAGFQGLVVGPGKDVASTQNGDQYLTPFIEDAYFYAGLGYDGVPGNGDDIQIVSNSFGFSGTDNDGFDFESRLIDAINRQLAPNTALLFSTGNGAAGYGTAAPPSPSTSIGIGASTLYGTIGGTGGFEAIASADQILGGDPMSWSNRGAGVRNVAGADVVATGAFGTGDVPLNAVLWGAVATESFGGTSMSSPVAAGNLALMYQAWEETHGSWPTFDEARALLMGSATDTEHDIWTQGAGLVNADIGTDVAAGVGGGAALPSQWSVGDYRGTEYEAFAHIISPGASDTQTFQLMGDVAGVSDFEFTKIGSTDYSFTTLDQSLDHGLFTTPDYAFRIDGDIPAATDMLEVMVTKPYEQFNPTGSLALPPGGYNNWRVHLQNWTDLDGDGVFWDDANGNGKVDASGEMETGEHIRFTYGYNFGPSQQARIANLDRIADGLLLTLRHRDQAAEVPNTDLTIVANYYEKVDWDWVTASVSGGGVTATIDIPGDAPYGMYEGSIEVEMTDGTEVVIPVTVAVAADGTSFDFGGVDQSHLPYDNGAVFGYTDYSWRAESGDWRFFWTDIAASDLPEEGAGYLVVDTQWGIDPANVTDIDTVILGPTVDGFGPASIYGPYTLSETGRSNFAYVGSGRWGYETSSGGPHEIVSAPLQEGLHSILLHQVRPDGDLLAEPFTGLTGKAVLSQASISGGPVDSATVEVDSEIPFGTLVADGFGLSAPDIRTETAQQDDPNDPSSASVKVPVTLDHAGLLRVETQLGTDDLDLFLVYDADTDGNFTNDEVIASSTTPTSNEFIEIKFPADGDYEVWVQGWDVTGTPDFTLIIDAVQGHDITADTSVPGEVTVSWDITGAPAGTYGGVLLFGPTEAPGLFEVPIEVTVP
jgi:hypothetical protein